MVETSGPPDPVERVERELGVLLRRSRAFSHQVSRAVHPDLEASAYGLMVRLDAIDEARMTDLASWLGVGKPTVSRQVAILEDLALVVRAPDPADARAQLLSLTEEGRRRLSVSRDARRARFRGLLEAWPAGDVDELGRLMHAFNALDL